MQKKSLFSFSMFLKLKTYNSLGDFMLKDNTFRYTFYLNRLYITNYLEIISITDTLFIVKTSFGKLKVTGNKLKIKKLLYKTLFIEGIIKNIEAVYE